MYDDTWVNVLEEALLIQTNHKNKRIKKKKKFKHKSYDYEDSAKLIQILFTTYVFNKIKRNIIIKCPQIDTKMTDGLVKHVGVVTLTLGLCQGACQE